MSMILISHDINLIKKYCDKIIVMKEGKILEIILLKIYLLIHNMNIQKS
jgi:ABC-type dipeptide/oligopeptide/nickel transport system ATPase component